MSIWECNSLASLALSQENNINLPAHLKHTNQHIMYHFFNLKKNKKKDTLRFNEGLVVTVKSSGNQKKLTASGQEKVWHNTDKLYITC